MKSVSRPAAAICLAVAASLLPALPAAAAAITVNDDGDTAADDGVCTLREAITSANTDTTSGAMGGECPAGSGADTVSFNITPDTIAPTSDLPAITASITIDGTTDPDSDRIAIDGAGAAAGANGLTLAPPASSNSTIKGLVIQGFSSDILDTGGNGITGNVGNFGTITVGGTAANEGNVLSGNEGYGAQLEGGSGTFVVLGNIVGLNSNGTTPLPNGTGGLSIQAPVPATVGGTIGVSPGGSCTGACNLISGNAGNGLFFAGAGSVRGNYVGTDVTGLKDRGNAGEGIFIGATGGSGPTIGGATAPEGNVVAGNGDNGICLCDVNAGGVVIRGNNIGVGSDGSTAIPNAFRGVYSGGDNNTVGGTFAGQGNIIAFNGGQGVFADSAAVGDKISGNSIRWNGGLGIDLQPTFVNPNDAGDGDSGANAGQNFPVLTAASSDATDTTVQGTLNSQASATFGLDFYSTPSCDPAGNGEGAVFLGSDSVTTDAMGDATINKTFSTVVPGGQFITATATDANGNTSEFSACRQVQATVGGPTISIDDPARNEGNSGTANMTFTLTLSKPAPGSVTVNWATTDDTATAPSDYTFSSGVVMFPMNDTVETVNVPVVGDQADEPNETVLVNLSGATGATIADSQGQGVIIDDDDLPGLAIDDVTVIEGQTGTTSAIFTVTRSGDTDGTSTVDYASEDGTATAPADYESTNGTLTFVPDDTSETLTVLVKGDTLDEPNEQFSVNLFAPGGAVAVDSLGLGIITDDDAPPPPPLPPAPAKCPGFESDPRPQVVGTDGNDTLTATPANEIVCGLGGNDVLRGGGGNDLVLGGGGNDRLAGQAGNDVLKGQSGKDRMSGGPGSDRCQGGPGKDTARSCEKGRA